MQNTTPIFQTIFAHDWSKLPSVFHKHYANRPFSQDSVVTEGKMTIEFGWLITLLSPLLRLFNVLVPQQGHDIPVIVHFLSEPNSNAFCLERTFYFPNKKPYLYCSKLIPTQDDIVIETMQSSIGWKHRFYYDGKKIILEHRGYTLNLFGKTITLPITPLLGKGHAEEIALSDNCFAMKMTITHPLFGKIYEYRGKFEIKQVNK